MPGQTQRRQVLTLEARLVALGKLSEAQYNTDAENLKIAPTIAALILRAERLRVQTGADETERQFSIGNLNIWYLNDVIDAAIYRQDACSVNLTSGRRWRLTAKSSCVLYSEVDVSDDLVGCIYFVKNECRAQPFVSRDKAYYKPTDEEQKDFCKNRTNVKACPRLQAYQTHSRAIGLEKEGHH